MIHPTLLRGGPANGQMVSFDHDHDGFVLEGGPGDGTRYLLQDGVLVYEKPVTDESL